MLDVLMIPFDLALPPVFSKCKGVLQDGGRLENISWRLWHRELVSSHPYQPPTPHSISSDSSRCPSFFDQNDQGMSRSFIHVMPITNVINHAM
jgi:hypothetical protein